MEIDAGQVALLIVTGVIAGLINTIAGGGSNLTLPALMVWGLPADIANATNRVAVLLQNLVALAGFKRYDKLPTDDIAPLLIPTLIGGLAGAGAAVYAPVELLKPLLLSAMIGMSLIILIKPAVVCPPAGTVAYKMKERPSSWWWLGAAGFYGGFVQAGVGFILVTALAGVLRYDLVRSNALKHVCALGFTLVALLVFIYLGLVLWLPGLILGIGMMCGAHLAVKFAVTARPETLKWFLFFMTLCTCVAALMF